MKSIAALLGPVFGVALWAAAAAAQDAKPDEKKGIEPGPWTVDVIASLNLSQSTFSNNWSGGDKGSVTWVAGSDVTAERQFNKTFNWKNVMKLAYGQTLKQIQDPDNASRKVWEEPEKTTDLIQLESVSRFTLQKFVDPYAAFRLDSQFVDESDPRGRILFNPVRLKETAGVARVIEKTDESEFITRLGFGLRQSLARTFADSIGEETKSFSANDGGFEWQTDVKRPILEKRVLYTGQLLVYMPVFYSASDDLEEFDVIAREIDPAREEVADFWKTPDVNFQNTFTAQITKVLAVNLYLQWIYDKFSEATNVDTALAPALLIQEVDRGIRRGGQFKQTLALGLTFNLF